MSTLTLNNGIVIRDNRHLNCGILIENQKYDMVTLGYNSIKGFYLNIKGSWLTSDETKTAITILIEMQKVCEEANMIIAKNL